MPCLKTEHKTPSSRVVLKFSGRRWPENNHLDVFCKKDVLKKFVKLTENTCDDIKFWKIAGLHG